MSHSTSSSARHLWVRTAAFLDRVMDDLFSPDDAFAASQGWQVQRSRFSRTYRDPRFDTRTARMGR